MGSSKNFSLAVVSSGIHHAVMLAHLTMIDEYERGTRYVQIILDVN
jgi:hypothetical protein